ncbi:2-oxo acid dehydrogenase subunit E2 [Herbiconiux sp. CPCC 205763]|uniref:Dihydrolipoamide acetyltransferase component of pyruvate dehydrogenase complex n=1 Tax=Herbiconiux aconitum TaxID=2970913 RepID=A0ABT2GLQ3_9MICO|nr:2-oxo acid dehydrogenase subunit E2 [Herbiconiux aconitum]MCS5717144.1 2-oxo acid dehydrogenase subunit E2 [Herbiconiux aconitum]
MAQIIRMPSVLAGSEEAAIANWLVTEGQVIAVGEPLAEIETEKAIVEYNAEEAGIVGRVLLAAGESGEIGAPIAVLIAEGETAADIDAALGGSPAAPAAAAAADTASEATTDAPATPAASPTASGASALSAPAGAAGTVEPESGASARDPESGAPVAEAASVAQAASAADTLDPAASASATATTTGSAPVASGQGAASGQGDPSGEGDASGTAPGGTSASRVGDASGDRLFVSPIARKLARERGLDPATIAGSGPGGRIVRRDVEEALASGSVTAAAPASPASASASPAASGVPAAPAAPAPASAASTATTGDWDLIPHTGMRRAIARRLTESKSTVPHFYLTAEPRVDALLALRAEVNAQSPVRVSVNDFVVKAVAAAFAEVPEANVTWSDEGMRKHHAVDIAVAVATDGGLLTPVVRGVDSKSLTAVSSTIQELVAKAKDKRLKQDELEGGSFSVSNLGMYGTVEFSAILNPPQSGILAVGAAKQQAVVIDGELAVATVMRCTLSVDHRAVDGALAAQWLAAFTKRIENPLSILL